MNGGNCNKKVSRMKLLDKSDSDLDEESMNDMLVQVVSAKASSSSTGQKVYISHPS